MKHFVLYECCCVNHKTHADYKKEDAYRTIEKQSLLYTLWQAKRFSKSDKSLIYDTVITNVA